MFNNYRFRKNINDSEDIFPSPYLHSMFFNKYRFRNNIDSEDIFPPPLPSFNDPNRDKDQYHFDHKKCPGLFSKTCHIIFFNQFRFVTRLPKS